MKPHKENFSVHMVKNSRPVGKIFKRKKTVSNGVSPSNFKFGDVSKSDFKQNVNSRTEGKVKFTKGTSEGSPDVSKISNGISKKAKWQTEKPNKSPLLPKKDDETKVVKTSVLPVTKRKFDEDATSPNQKKPKKKMKSDPPIKKTNGDAVTSSESKPTMDSDAKPTMDSDAKPTKKKRKKKKKKKKVPESGDAADTQYKPVWVAKKPADFSANWKNLKEMVIQNDKEQAAAKLKEDEGKQVKWKQYKGKKFDKNHDAKKERVKLRDMMEEQQKESKKYEAQKKKQSAKTQELEPKKKKKKNDDIWFDNVDPILLGEDYNVDEEKKEETEADAQQVETDEPKAEKEESAVADSEEGESKAVAMDCEMVGVGINGKESVLARVSIVNQYCKVIYDKYVKPRETVVDYRTEFSGIRPEDIRNGNDFKEVQAEVAKILNGKILVGHGLSNDLRVLFLQHPRSRIRDTAKYKAFKTMFKGFTPKLKMLTKRILGVDIQTGEHDSIQDAQAVMRIYTVHKREWDSKKKKVFDKPIKKTKKKEDLPST